MKKSDNETIIGHTIDNYPQQQQWILDYNVSVYATAYHLVWSGLVHLDEIMKSAPSALTTLNVYETTFSFRPHVGSRYPIHLCIFLDTYYKCKSIPVVKYPVRH